jgi:RimJ/RimL family protein N-acetyltransferase
MAVTIEPIAEHHIEGYHQVVDIVARARRFIAMTEALPLESMHRFVMSNIEKGYAHFVAVDGEAVVGWCDITPVSARETFRHRGVLGMGLLPGYRGRGHGSALLRATMDKARAVGFVRIELHVYADNHPAIGLYRKHGFVEEGVLRDGAYIDGAFRDLLQMVSVDRSALRARPAE